MLQQFQETIKNIISTSEEVARKLHVLALSRSYDRMIEEIQEIAPIAIPEVDRAPILLEYFVSYLRENKHRHIDPQMGSFIKEELLGSRDEWRAWRDRALPPEAQRDRSDASYGQRLLNWMTLYDEDGRSATFYKKPIPSYEEVIQRRMALTQGDVPYWYLWEVGDPRAYPSYPGIFYIEAGWSSLPGFTRESEMMLYTYLNDYLRTGKQPRLAAINSAAFLALYAKI